MRSARPPPTGCSPWPFWRCSDPYRWRWLIAGGLWVWVGLVARQPADHRRALPERCAGRHEPRPGLGVLLGRPGRMVGLAAHPRQRQRVGDRTPPSPSSRAPGPPAHRRLVAERVLERQPAGVQGDHPVARPVRPPGRMGGCSRNASPRTGCPRAAACTRSWCIRPVCGVSSSSVASASRRSTGTRAPPPWPPRRRAGRISSSPGPAPCGSPRHSPASGGHDPFDPRPVDLGDGVRLELLGDPLGGLGVPAEDDHAGHRPVEPVRDAEVDAGRLGVLLLHVGLDHRLQATAPRPGPGS